MKPLRSFLLLALVLAPCAPAAAQQSRGLTPYVGAALGASDYPDAFAECSADGRLSGELRGGLAYGAVAVEARAGGLVGGYDVCVMSLAQEVYLPGRHTSIEHPFERADLHTSAELRARLTLPVGFPLVVAAGAGRIAPQNVAFLVASAGVRTRGRIRLAADLDRRWYRVPFDVVVRDYDENGPVCPAVSRERRSDWRAGLGMRLGVEVPLR